MNQPNKIACAIVWSPVLCGGLATVISLSAAIGLLNARLGQVPESPRVEFGPGQRKGQAA